VPYGRGNTGEFDRAPEGVTARTGYNQSGRQFTPQPTREIVDGQGEGILWLMGNGSDLT
jgi:hypothetical protein